MGTVYQAVDQTMARPVAIKLIQPDPTAEDDAVQRFLREARNTAKITHPHIVHLYDLGRGEGGELFIVMELLSGESLSQRLRREPMLSVDEVVHVGRQICAALGYAHKKGLVHRDLKPGNVMIVERGGDPLFVKVLDFGVAKAQDQRTQITKTGALVGTVDYMAPEQILSRQVDPRTDVYSLGVILYRLFTGTPLFPEGAAALVIKNHVSSIPEPMQARAPSIALSAALDQVVLRCLAKRPEERFATMEELDFALVRAAREPRAPLGGGDFDDLSMMQTIRRESPFEMESSSQRPAPMAALPGRAPDSETKLAIPRNRESPASGARRVPSSEVPSAAFREPRVAPLGERRPHTAPMEQRPAQRPAEPAALARPRSPASGAHALLTPPASHRSGEIAAQPAVVTPTGTGDSKISQLRWLGLLAPLPAALYAVWQRGSVLSLVLLAMGFVVGALLFFLSAGRTQR